MSPIDTSKPRAKLNEDEAAVLDMFEHVEEDSEFEEYREHPPPVQLP